MRKLLIKLFLLVLIFLLLMNTQIQAATIGSFSISSSTNLNVGDNTNLSISVKNCEGQFSITSSDSNVVSVSSSSEWVDDKGKVVQLSAKKAGTAVITVTATNVSDNQSEPEDVEGSKTITITVAEQKPTTPSTPDTPTVTEKSSNANVKMIETSPVDFTGFKPGKTSGYEVEVENDVDRITVKVTKEDSKASVSLLNRTNSDSGKSWVYIAEGKNEIDITVTSEDGKNKKTYTINVTRKAKEAVEEGPTQPEEQEPEVEEPTTEEPIEEVIGLSKLTISGVKLEPEFKTDVYEYKINLKEDLVKLNITTVATNAKSKVEITGNENLQEGENIITIIVKGEVEAETVAYQIIVNKTIPVVENTINLEPDHQNMIQKNIIIPVAAGIVLVIIVTAVIITKFSNNNSNNGYIPYENVIDDYEEEQTLQEDELYEEEEIIRKPRSKGKRFK